MYMLVYALDVHRKFILRGKPMDGTDTPHCYLVLATVCIALPSVYAS